ncbi:MAG TPA: fibronectin type III domain-containing protein, partial [Chryseosolibacter sp.]|nr:fibronectin type III domain-containing protein [Chryseosolibacter sp.]
STSLALDGLSPGTEYTASVAPHCIGTEAYTSTTFSTICYAPFDLSVDAITRTTAELSWDDDFGAMPYFIDYSIAGSNNWKTRQTPSTSMSLSDLRPGTRYEVRVHIRCVSQTAPYASVFFETGLYDETTFGPSPTDRVLSIYPSKNLIGNRFSILDSTGRIISSGTLADYTLELAGLGPGIYTLTVEGERPMRFVKRQ